MRVLKVALLSLLSVVVTAIVAVSALVIYSSIDKQDRFFVRNAEFANVDYLRDFTPGHPVSPDEEEQLAVYSHRLKAGRGSVLAYRFYSNGSLGMIDDEEYRKLTIWIAEPLPSATARVSLDDRATATAIFTRGGSAWPHDACSGYLSAGEVEIVPLRRTYLVRVDAFMDPIVASTVMRCRRERVQLAFEASEITHTELTPWLGMRGSHPYNETYR